MLTLKKKRTHLTRIILVETEWTCVATPAIDSFGVLRASVHDRIEFLSGGRGALSERYQLQKHSAVPGILPLTCSKSPDCHCCESMKVVVGVRIIPESLLWRLKNYQLRHKVLSIVKTSMTEFQALLQDRAIEVVDSTTSEVLYTDLTHKEVRKRREEASYLIVRYKRGLLSTSPVPPHRGQQINHKQEATTNKRQNNIIAR